jgi:hypothetical protein
MTEALKSVRNPVTQKKIRVSPSTSSGEVLVVDSASTLIPLEAASGIVGADAARIRHSHSNRRVSGVAEQALLTNPLVLYEYCYILYIYCRRR